MTNESVQNYFPYTHGDHIEKERQNLKNELKAEFHNKQLLDASIRGQSAGEGRSATSPQNNQETVSALYQSSRHSQINGNVSDY